MLAALAAAALAAPARATPAAPLVLAFGDSLSAGYGLDPGLGYIPQLQSMLRRHGIAATVADGAVSGDTSSAGRARLGWTLDGLPARPDLVLLELGGNDMLRGLDPDLTRANLDAMLAELRRRRLNTVLVGMRAAPNLDPAYRRRFEAIYPDLAKKHGVTLIPFFLDGVAAVPGKTQPDAIHPTFEGVKTMVMTTLPVIRRALGR